jgi:hypothetical protein
VGVLLAAALVGLPVAHAATPVKVENEINRLLGAVEGSGCEFYRNGSWYNSQDAVAHLRGKYKYLSERNLVNTTEQFIERAGSESSMSGRPYRIRCNGGSAVSSQQWLHEKLAVLRAAK